MRNQLIVLMAIILLPVGVLYSENLPRGSSTPAIYIEENSPSGATDPLSYIGKSSTMGPLDPAIYIVGNAQLATFATSGNGSIDYPYLIANYTIISTSTAGVRIHNTTKYFILRNVRVSGGLYPIRYAFHLTYVTNGILENNIASQDAYGFVLQNCNNNRLTNNTASNIKWSGFNLRSSSHNRLTGNIAHYCEKGFWLEPSSNFNRLTSNAANNTSIGFGLDKCNGNRLTSNAANNTSVGFGLWYSNNNTLTNNTAHNNENGFELYVSHHNTLTNNTARNNNCGFELYDSNNNTLTNNTARNNDYPIRTWFRPSAPQNLVGTVGTDFVELTWTAPTMDGGSVITEYHIYRSTTSGSRYNYIGRSATTSFIDNTVSNGVTNYYVVTAVNAIGEGTASNEVSATLPAISSSNEWPGWTFFGLIFVLVVIGVIRQARRQE